MKRIEVWHKADGTPVCPTTQAVAEVLVEHLHREATDIYRRLVFMGIDPKQAEQILPKGNDQ